MIQKGSIVSVYIEQTSDPRAEDEENTQVSKTTVHTISIVKKIKDDMLICSESILSLDGEPYVRTRKKYPGYGGERIESVTLCSVEEFDLLVDSELIDRRKLIDVGGKG